MPLLVCSIPKNVSVEMMVNTRGMAQQTTVTCHAVEMMTKPAEEDGHWKCIERVKYTKSSSIYIIISYFRHHSTKKPVTTMLTYPWKCIVLHCNHLGNTWKPLVLMTQHFDYCPSARAIIKVSGHQHQWFPGVSQVVTM